MGAESHNEGDLEATTTMELSKDEVQISPLNPKNFA